MKYDKLTIDRNINIDIIDMMSDGLDSGLTADELLPVVAAPITRFDFDKCEADNPLYKAVKKELKRGKIAYALFDRNSTIQALKEKWADNLGETMKMALLVNGAALIRDFTEDGYAVFSEKIYYAYRKLMDGGRFSRIEYGRDVFDEEQEKEWRMITDLAKGTILEGHRLWSWKCNSDFYADGLPKELCCVEKNEWHEGPLLDIKPWEAGSRGSVSRSWYDFAHNIKEDDFVILRDWEKNVIVGIGQFKGEYRYEPERESFRSRRTVEWISTEQNPSPVNIGRGNTSPMPIEDPEVFSKHLPFFKKMSRSTEPKEIVHLYIGGEGGYQEIVQRGKKYIFVNNEAALADFLEEEYLKDIVLSYEKEFNSLEEAIANFSQSKIKALIEGRISRTRMSEETRRALESLNVN